MAYNEDLSLEGVEDPDELASKVEKFYKQDGNQKSALAYNWERNHLFLDGKQWLVFDGVRDTGGSWRELRPFAQNEYIPRPVTNYIFDAFQTLKGYILKNKPRITVSPNTQTYKDKTAAMIAELVSETNWKRLSEAYNYEYAASCLIVYGTVFKKSYWDNSFISQVKIPKMVPQPATDPQTGAPTGQVNMVQATDPQTGDPVFDELPLGDLNTSVIEPYRLALDPLAVNMHDLRWIMEYSIHPLTWIKENYTKDEPGYTNRTEEVKEEKSLPNTLRKFFQLRTSSGVRALSGNSSLSNNSSGSGEMIDNAAVVKEYYERPTKAHPKGRLIVVANGIPLYIGDSPYEGEEQGDWHPYSECRWEPVPGRFWGKSPFDDACEIQKHINSIDSLIMLVRKTMAVPQKLEIDGQVINAQWTGEPGQRIKYKPGPGGEKPETIMPVGVDPQVWKEREQKVSDLKQLTGAVDILKGDRPPGVTAASALALLFEVGTGKLFPILDRWKNLVEQDQKKQLKLIAKKYREPRPDFINLLVSKNSELSPDLIRKFIGDDLHDNCNVVIEASSSIPKLKAAEHALLLELQQTGALNLEDPGNKQEFLNRLGITGFDSDYSKDQKRAELENMQLDEVLIHPEHTPQVMQFDNHDVHLHTLHNRMKEPSWYDLPLEVQQAYFKHESEHIEAQQQAQQQQIMQQAMMQGPGGPMQPPAPPQSPMSAGGAANAPQERIRKGPGIDSKVKQMLGSDLLGNTAGVGKN